MTKKDLYDQWNTKTLGGSTKLSVENFDLIQDGVHVEAPNEDSLNLIQLIGEITNSRSSSGPIPGTTKIVSDAQVGDATAAVVFRPDDDNSVWSLEGADVTHGGGGGGTIRTRLKLYDGVTLIEIGDESFSGNTNPFEPKGNYGPVHITYDVYLVQQVTGSTGGDEETSTVNISVSRVR